MKIDVHTHILPPDLLDFPGYPRLQHHACGADLVREDGTVFRKLKSNCYFGTQCTEMVGMLT